MIRVLHFLFASSICLAATDPYDLLGVSPDSSDVAIKAAYRALALKYHPDRNPGDAHARAKFEEATEAYRSIETSEKRQALKRSMNIQGQVANLFGRGGVAKPSPEKFRRDAQAFARARDMDATSARSFVEAAATCCGAREDFGVFSDRYIAALRATLGEGNTPAALRMAPTDAARVATELAMRLPSEGAVTLYFVKRERLFRHASRALGLGEAEALRFVAQTLPGFEAQGVEKLSSWLTIHAEAFAYAREARAASPEAALEFARDALAKGDAESTVASLRAQQYARSIGLSESRAIELSTRARSAPEPRKWLDDFRTITERAQLPHGEGGFALSAVDASRIAEKAIADRVGSDHYLKAFEDALQYARESQPGRELEFAEFIADSGPNRVDILRKYRESFEASRSRGMPSMVARAKASLGACIRAKAAGILSRGK